MPATLFDGTEPAKLSLSSSLAASAALEEFHEASDQALPGRNQIVSAVQKNPPEDELARHHAG